MALRTFDVTLLATQTRAISTHLPVSSVRIESESGNSAVNFGLTGLTTAVYGGTVLAGPAEVTAVTLGGHPHGLLNLDELWFLGTENDVIHLTVITP